MPATADVELLKTANRNLLSSFERLYGIVANTVWGTKKVAQLGAVAVAWYFYGQWVAAAVLGFLVLVESLDAGYEKLLKLKADVAGQGVEYRY